MRNSPSVQRNDQGRARAAQQGNNRRSPADTWETPYAWLAGWRTWSPGVAPPLLGLLLVFAATIPSEPHSAGRLSETTTSVPVPILFLMYFGCGASYGLGLYFAPSLNNWAKTLLGGGVVYVLAALWLLWGWPLLVLGTIVWGGLLIYYLRVCRHVVPPGRLYITTLGGRYWRSIPEGPALLLPGEQVREETPNPVKQFESPLARVHLRDVNDDRFVIEARATVTYRLAAVDALSRRSMPATWESDLEKTIRDALRDVLALAGHSALRQKPAKDYSNANGGPGDRQTRYAVRGQELAEALLERVRAQVRHHGLAIGWVRIRDLALSPDPRFGRENAEPAGVAAPVTLPPLGTEQRNSMQGVAAGAGPRKARAAEPTAAEEELSLEALLDLYNTVRTNDINDPDTIRSIAEAFRALAREQASNLPPSFDAEEVADLLFEYAASMQ
jgi:SPFH domain / Band 7 family